MIKLDRRLAVLLAVCAAFAAPANAKDDSGGVFMGAYGYAVERPAGYTASTGFYDAAKTREKVLLHPAGAPEKELDEKHYGKHGIIRLDVSPILVRGASGDRRASLKEFLVIIPQVLKRNGETFTVKKFESPFPGSIFTIKGRTPLVQVILEGAKVVYIFTAAEDGPALRKVVASLKELPPAGGPGL